MNKYKILFTQTFKDMFKYQFDKYKSYSPTYALNIKKKLNEAISALEIFPYATPSVKFRGKSETYRKFIIKKIFLIVFKVVDDTIYLLYFIDGRQAPKNYFKIYKD